MKKILVILFLSSCGLNSENVKNDNVKDTVSKQGYLKIAQQFSETFVMDTILNNAMKQIHNFPDSIITAFKAIRFNKEEQEKYLTLLYLKIYTGHLICCHQSYELRKNPNAIGIDSLADPLLYEYNLITHQFNQNKRIEFVSSALAYSWIEKNNYLLSYEPIKKEYNKLKRIEKGIEEQFN